MSRDEAMPEKAIQTVLPIDEASDARAAGVFSGERALEAPPLPLPPRLKPNTRLVMDGLEFLSLLPDRAVPVAFFDPQYRGILDKLSYGNEGVSRGRGRNALRQMPEATITRFLLDIDRVLMPSGHLFLWVDKFHLCEGIKAWLEGTELDVVDLVTWNKGRMGMGYRTRRTAEYCAVLQKRPRKAKGVWKTHNIADVWPEKVPRSGHPHGKPVGLQGELMAAVSNEGDFVIDPAAGSFSVLEAAMNRRRTFLGCDLEG